MINYVCGFYVSDVPGDPQRVLLIKKNKPAWQKDKLNGVGGKVEEGETVPEAMRREFREEAGVDLEGWEHRLDLTIPHVAVVHFFVLRGNEVLWPNPCDEGIFHSIPVASLYEWNTIPNLRWIIPLCLDKDIKFTGVHEVDHVQRRLPRAPAG